MSSTDIGMAKYVQARFPISMGMLYALKTYLRKSGWQEAESSVFLAPLDGGIRVDVPRDPFTPDVISAAQAVADVFEMLAVQLHITLEEAIDRVKHVFEDQQRGEFQTAGHCTLVSDAGVVIYDASRVDLDDPDDIPGFSDMLLLDPLEAVQIAQHILSHQRRLMPMHEVLEAEFEKLSQELLAELLKEKGHAAFSSLKWNGDVQHAYISLFIRDGTEIQAWRREAFKEGRFAHDLKEQLFLRYFNWRYKAQILPKVEEAEQEDSDEEEADQDDDPTVSHNVERFRYE
jgi:hypothetical protein